MAPASTERSPKRCGRNLTNRRPIHFGCTAATRSVQNCVPLLSDQSRTLLRNTTRTALNFARVSPCATRELLHTHTHTRSENNTALKISSAAEIIAAHLKRVTLGLVKARFGRFRRRSGRRLSLSAELSEKRDGGSSLSRPRNVAEDAGRAREARGRGGQRGGRERTGYNVLQSSAQGGEAPRFSVLHVRHCGSTARREAIFIMGGPFKCPQFVGQVGGENAAGGA